MMRLVTYGSLGIKPLWVVDQQKPLQGGIGNDRWNKVHQVGIVGYLLVVGVGEVSPPETALRGRFDEPARQWNGIGERGCMLRHPIRSCRSPAGQTAAKPAPVTLL